MIEILQHQFHLQKSVLDDVFPKKSKTAIVLGNGPSIVRFSNDFGRERDNNDAVIIGVNRIFVNTYLFFRPIHYYIAIDRTCWREDRNALKALKCERYFMYERFHQAANYPRMCFFDLNSDPWHVAKTRDHKPGHNFTSMAPATQLALMQGAERIVYFGIDCAPDSDGQTHAHGTMRRQAKQWANVRAGTANVLKRLREYGVEYTIYSDIYKDSNGNK